MNSIIVCKHHARLHQKLVFNNDQLVQNLKPSIKSLTETKMLLIRPMKFVPVELNDGARLPIKEASSISNLTNGNARHYTQVNWTEKFVPACRAYRVHPPPQFAYANCHERESMAGTISKTFSNLSDFRVKNGVLPCQKWVKKGEFHA